MECYNKGVCPYCGSLLLGRPNQTMKCPSCDGRVRTRNNFFTGQKGFFREDEADILNAAAKERARRNFICGIMERQELSVRDIRAIQGKRNCTIEEVLIEATAAKASEHHRNRDMGLCRNSMFLSGEVYMHMGDISKALTRFLQVCFYDANGCMNAGGAPGFPKYDVQSSILAPAVLKYVRELAGKQEMSKTQLRDAFLAAVGSIYEQDVPRRPEQAWKAVSKELWPDE